MKDKLEMRVAYSNTLDKFMSEDNRICVLDADLAKACATLNLKEKYPKRALDIGIAEQNMASIAAGLSAYGFIPFINTFTPFATRRICDQIAISIAYAKRNVKIVGVDPGISAQLNGGTHMSVEDIGVVRSIPNIVIFEPVDVEQLLKAMPQVINYNGPVYMRLFRLQAEKVYKGDEDFDLFKGYVLSEGSDVSIFASGMLVSEAVKAKELLKEEGISAEIIDIHTIKPLDRECILKSVSKTNAVVTAENHNVIGGLASAVSEVLVQNYLAPMEVVGIKDHFGEVGYQDYLAEKFGLTAKDIVIAAKRAIERKNGGK